MRKLYNFLPLLFIPALILLLANGSGSPGGKSGSPGDSNATCTQCHSGAANSSLGWITSDIPSNGYTPGETYTITATGTHNGVVKFGFELTAETTNGSKTGTFAITEAARTKLVNQNKAVTHRAAGTTPSGNTNSWSMNWTAPATDVGQIRFYAAYNAANGNGNNSGDVIYTSNLFVSAAQPGVLISVSPDHADQNQEVIVTITGQNTNWSNPSPSVSMQNSNNNNETFNASQVQVNGQTILQATFLIPADATIGMYDLLVDDLVLPSSFLVTVINSIEANIESFATVYPNPASNNIWIETQTESSFSLYDLSGKLLVQESLNIGKSSIDISDFRPGIYMTVIQNSNTKVINKLIIK
jgi:hypothetical protein